MFQLAQAVAMDVARADEEKKQKEGADGINGSVGTEGDDADVESSSED